MPNINAPADTFSCPNFLGELFQVGGKKTPFLNMIGGLNGQGKKATSFEFPVSQDWALDAASQPEISEDAASTAPPPTTYVRSQHTNTVQIFQRAVKITYAKQSSVGALSGINIEGSNPVKDEKAFQIDGNLKQIAQDVEYSFINGRYQAATAANVPAKTRGMIEAATTNVVDAGSAALTTDMLDDLVRIMADNGAPFTTPVLFAGSRKSQQISKLYKESDKFTSHERNIGGVAVKSLIFDFVEVGIVWCPSLPHDALLIADMSYIAPVFVPVPGKGYLFYEELAKKGAAEEGQLYGQIGLYYGPEAAHGKIIGLAA